MIILLILATSLLTCCGQIAQKFTAQSWAALASGTSRWAILDCPWPWLASISLVLGLGCWLGVLRHMDVGVAYPMLSLNFVLVALAGRYLFGEVLPGRNLAGIALIASGVLMLGGLS
ncbi:4-amino-4-deoxy-L-arabinose-phospho-UDP flippase [Pseudomonas parafulva]|uniref:4-amino-4-deoxy-L-arabinose-phospho-UDP flippase n=1 Tax=Pseudomonas parafulva TaxID=157782 RepID=A0AAI8KBP6_9PSED|nr:MULTISPECIES: hypothetical protein [Pseudomonas]AIZ33053.1 hypothetical protein NJ69_08690 [Pseudomonas parafulva]AXO88662.1 4-amino-4-deoxy-L-arabinose-phospho-UDP flippase [Pseudomonas parafulva]MDV9033352.1 4-amino-4-deoxy-L-arabinose-phospho-UDP flippase [Pseudomonas sp. RAC1]